MKKIEELSRIKGDAFDYYVKNADAALFEKIFLVDEILDDIRKKDTYFLIGEKGSGKTAYSVYMSRKENDVNSSIVLVQNTLFQKFINMKQQKMLGLSEMKDVWVNLLYLVLAERLKDLYKNSFLGGMKTKGLNRAISEFYSNAFKPELVNAFEFVDNASSSINAMIEAGVFNGSGKIDSSQQKKYVEQSYQISLMKIRDGFEKVFEEFDLKKQYILFIDGVDARPYELDSKVYFDCITSLVNAVLEMNAGVLAYKNIKIMPLMCPDVMYRLPVHNMNQKLRENSVLLNWQTTYKDYVQSKLFKVADNYFSKQQDKFFAFEECWDHYFPYRVSSRKKVNDNPFVEFLRYSTYKPRDILTMLNEMVDATKGDCFCEKNFQNMLSNYSRYIEGELKDYLLIYMSDENYADLRAFFSSFIGHRRFDFNFFVETHLKYIKYLREIGRSIPSSMSTAQETLQMLYDANIIGYEGTHVDNGWRMHWSYKERSYANMRPPVQTGGKYVFHLAYAKAFGIV